MSPALRESAYGYILLSVLARLFCPLPFQSAGRVGGKVSEV
jgi:hypothetical protein